MNNTSLTNQRNMEAAASPWIRYSNGVATPGRAMQTK